MALAEILAIKTLQIRSMTSCYNTRNRIASDKQGLPEGGKSSLRGPKASFREEDLSGLG
jgi:hypothetical protein